MAIRWTTDEGNAQWGIPYRAFFMCLSENSVVPSDAYVFSQNEEIELYGRKYFLLKETKVTFEKGMVVFEIPQEGTIKIDNASKIGIFFKKR